MATIKEIEQDILDLNSLMELTRIYGEIASLRMKATRAKVLNSRGFIAAVNEVFQEVLASYKKEVLKIVESKGVKRGQGVTLLAHNGKTVVVFLSSNTGLYGEIVRRTFELFIDDARKPENEITVVGKLGKTMYLSEAVNKPYTYFDLPDFGIDVSQLAALVRHLVQYERIIVYYGQFVNVLDQRPARFEISAQTLLTNVSTGEEKRARDYLFEPHLERILQFFETEMFAGLLEQTVRESQLSKYASRILAMDNAQNNIGESLEETRLTKLKVVHREKNAKQLGRLASVAARGL